MPVAKLPNASGDQIDASINAAFEKRISDRCNHRRLRYESLEGRQMLAVVAGDFNLDGNVNAADYVAWRITG